ncbi:sigma-70 family RNA polymerase sigma factor [Actinomadura sp. NAK00032]|uniref:sigma-70 family RNA polymerase sigma factor n=1 Tax=Actinomadura sp. NAK00032 TaxID=2742128 RepID=UPI0015920979|nr:sigma-70 family RNA polymerase sigma factor [Actinomadura sp. NAK00032]QKW33930.1 sigma-70 family RNA polymerase sigma factor [Actinomadura sp. NAK00032]
MAHDHRNEGRPATGTAFSTGTIVPKAPASTHYARQDRPGSLEEAAATFTEIRPRLFGIAYRMLLSKAEAEDVVQDAWLRWQHADHAAIANPAAFLTLITTRLALNALKSARVRRETYVGSWTPEPVDPGSDPAAGAEREEALGRALLLLLERLTPAQRAAYVLRVAFLYPYEQIAEIIQLSPANVRQLVSRARKHLSTGRCEPTDTGEHRRLLVTFLAAQDGDIAALEAHFAEDVVSSATGGTARLPRIGVNRWRGPARRTLRSGAVRPGQHRRPHPAPA